MKSKFLFIMIILSTCQPVAAFSFDDLIFWKSEPDKPAVCPEPFTKDDAKQVIEMKQRIETCEADRAELAKKLEAVEDETFMDKAAKYVIPFAIGLIVGALAN